MDVFSYYVGSLYNKYVDLKTIEKMVPEELEPLCGFEYNDEIVSLLSSYGTIRIAIEALFIGWSDEIREAIERKYDEENMMD